MVFSEGALYLDDCDFSGSTATTLVWLSEDGGGTTVVRNTVLGDNNCEWIVCQAGSQAGSQSGEADGWVGEG